MPGQYHSGSSQRGGYKPSYPTNGTGGEGGRYNDNRRSRGSHGSSQNRHNPYPRSSNNANQRSDARNGQQQQYQTQQYSQYASQYPNAQFSSSAAQQYTPPAQPYAAQQLLIQQQQQFLQQQQQLQQQMFNFPTPTALMSLAGQAMSMWQNYVNGAGHTDPASLSQYTQAYIAAPSAPPAPFQCQNCEKSFMRSSQYDTHMKTHIKCSECDFEASKKMVRLHEEEVHAIIDGVKRTFVCTDTPEEIAKWIADRKKKYPTDANIHAKELEEQERIARGEVIRGGRGNRGRGRGVTSSRPKEEKQQQENGLGLLNAYGSDSSPSESADSSSANSSSDSSSESEVESEEVPIPKPRNQQNRRMPICKYFLRNKCTKQECPFRHERPEPRQEPRPKPNTVNRRPLLKMLLESDIRKEKNQLLQCIRYIVQNNFFQEGTLEETS